jgi:hypothetical protein
MVKVTYNSQPVTEVELFKENSRIRLPSNFPKESKRTDEKLFLSKKEKMIKEIAPKKTRNA